MFNPINTIETAMVNRLALLNEGESGGRWPKGVANPWPEGLKCKYIDGYGGQFDTPEELAQAAQKAPGLWVAYEGEAGELGNGLVRTTLTFGVFCLARSFSPEQLRKGGPNVIGLYQLVEAVRLALTNQTLGLKMPPLEMTNITPLWRGGPQGGGISLAQVRFTTTVTVEVPSQPELDDIVCPTPLWDINWYLGDWDQGDKPGLPRATDQWRPNGLPISETEEGGEGAQP